MALIPPDFLDCVVAIGFDGSDNNKYWAASGFIYGDSTDERTTDEKGYSLYLVTNRHVLKGKHVVYIRFNPQEGGRAREFRVPLAESNGTPLWSAHPDSEVDIGVFRLRPEILAKHGIQYSFFADLFHVANRMKARETGITEGDMVYALGFPMGLVGEERNFVILRQGCIARIRDAYAGLSKHFLVDISIFPGNSGGPVVTKAELAAIEGTKCAQAAYLIGVVSAYIPYRDIAVSAQTQKTRIIFEENSGLAAVIQIDFVKETIQEHLKTFG